jgi:type II secretion system protein G
MIFNERCAIGVALAFIFILIGCGPVAPPEGQSQALGTDSGQSEQNPFTSVLKNRGQHINREKVKNDMEEIAEAMRRFHKDLGRCPTANEGLRALLTFNGDQSESKKWKGPYIPGLPLDNLNNEYQLVAVEDNLANWFNITCLGSDGFPSKDDLNLLRMQMEDCYQAIQDYAHATGSFPSSEDGLAVLVKANNTLVTSDPTGSPLNYIKTEQDDAPHPYKLSSSGPNDIPWDDDDVGIESIRHDRLERDLLLLTLCNTMFRTHVNRYPTTEEGLSALASRPANAEGWRGPYLQEEFFDIRDPWNRSFKYVLEEQNGEPFFDIWSLGPDEVDSKDDLHIRQVPNSEKFIIPEKLINEQFANKGLAPK